MFCFGIPSYDVHVYISQLICFEIVCSNVRDFIKRNHFDCLNTKTMLSININFVKHVLNSTMELITTNVGLKTLLLQGISEPVFMFTYFIDLK